MAAVITTATRAFHWTRNGEDDDDSNDSLKSWEGTADVFPDAVWEFETALKLKQGVRNADTERLLARVLGMEVPQAGASTNEDGDAAEDDDNVDEVGHFDMYSSIEFCKTHHWLKLRRRRLSD